MHPTDTVDKVRFRHNVTIVYVERNADFEYRGETQAILARKHHRIFAESRSNAGAAVTALHLIDKFLSPDRVAQEQHWLRRAPAMVNFVAATELVGVAGIEAGRRSRGRLKRQREFHFSFATSGGT